MWEINTEGDAARVLGELNWFHDGVVERIEIEATSGAPGSGWAFDDPVTYRATITIWHEKHTSERPNGDRFVIAMEDVASMKLENLVAFDTMMHEVRITRGQKGWMVDIDGVAQFDAARVTIRGAEEY